MRLNCLITSLITGLLLASSTSLRAEEKPRALFNGTSLDGWDVNEKEQQWWRVVDGAIAGGSLEQNVPYNTFISTNESFQNFELNCRIRIQGTSGFINSGVQIRSVRIPNNSEMLGYQVDAGDGWWGKLYDESRRNKVLAQPADHNAVNKAVRANDWNEYRIVAEGPRIRTWINGVPALDFTESDPKIPLDGHIGFQAHSGGKVQVLIKDITIKELPATPDAVTWASLQEKSPIKKGLLSPAEELAGFKVPAGFKVELVAAETPEYGKFVALAFDAQSRLWTTTALEYPVDANESPAESKELFQNGGRDKVLVIDRPWEEKPAAPRTFADGLVMPLGVLPSGHGAFVQYGNDIRFYEDTNGDGKADKHQVILTGFGVQDSHLFPHQFTRAPGGWILFAQGLFNSSKVQRPNGEPFADGRKEIPFVACKLGRFTPTGNSFEALSSGPNNIWGLTVSREGELWIQEANDVGFPIIPYEPGQRYPSGSADRLRPYQPQMPAPLGPPQMGGTGLCGLALSDDVDSPFSHLKNAELTPNAKLFYVANPITSCVQLIEATPHQGRYKYRKLSDFLTSQDPLFRPVAIQFGPDGCLYVIDWYNKIISHNEVPRNHPERDKRLGRIWRIRHESQGYAAPPNLTSLSNAEVVKQLGNKNARLADFAWQVLIDRKANDQVPALQQLLCDSGVSPDRRLGALWALEGLNALPTNMLVQLTSDKHSQLRHEAVRVAANLSLPVTDFVRVAAPLLNDPSPAVRAAVGDSLRRVRSTDPALIELLMKYAQSRATGDVWEVYDRDFERYLARWALELHPEEVAAFLDSPTSQKLPQENRVLATLSLPGPEAAQRLARLLPKLERPLHEEEMRVLLVEYGNPDVAIAVNSLLDKPETREQSLAQLLVLRTSINLRPALPVIKVAVEKLWTEAMTEQSQKLVFEAAGAFQLRELDAPIAQSIAATSVSLPMKLAGLKALRELGSAQTTTLAELATSSTQPNEIREAALATLAESPALETGNGIGELLEKLNHRQRKPVIESLARRRGGALALLKAVDDELLTEADLTPAILESIRLLTPKHPTFLALWNQVESRATKVLTLSGGAHDFVQTPFTLEGPFTIETWIRLKPEITNADAIAGNPTVASFNFYQSLFRVWFRNQGDLATVKRAMLADVWTHVAVTRDQPGIIRIYVNGELAATSTVSSQQTLSDLQIGRSAVGNAGTAGQLMEYRIWKTARSAQEIRDNFDRSFKGLTHPPELVKYFSGDDWGPLSGKASVQPALDAKQLLTPEQAQQQTTLFQKYRQLAGKPGDLGRGKAVFTKSCLVCHQQGGQGGNIAPPLDGVGLLETESMLRNILTPSAAMEGGYRTYQVVTRNGRVVQGLLVSDDLEAVVIRQPNVADTRIPHTEIERAEFLTSSIMPDGILNPFSDTEVADLFTYLRSLRPPAQALPR